MTRAVRTAAPDMLIMEVAQILLEQRIGGVPVVENGQVVGMITESDLFRLDRAAADWPLGRSARAGLSAPALASRALRPGPRLFRALRPGPRPGNPGRVPPVPLPQRIRSQ